MKALDFKKMDAFAQGTSSGNPAGCIYLGDTLLSENEMQRIARELKGFVNEVGYLSSSESGLALKFYSSECEVDFCGHATIAVMYDLISGDPELRKRRELPIWVNAGELIVENRLDADGAVYITAPLPKLMPTDASGESIAKALRIAPTMIDARLPIRLINAGLATLIIPLNSLEGCLAVSPDQEQLRLFCLANGIDIVLVFSKETALPTCQFRTRVFAPKFGYLEDPATGSGNAAFGHYLIKAGLWRGNTVIEQGPSREAPNIIRLLNRNDGENDRVLFGGAAVVRIVGKYILT